MKGWQEYAKSFTAAKRAKGKTEDTISFYEFTLKRWLDYSAENHITPATFDAHAFAEYVVFLSNLPIRPRTRHAYARSVRALVRWMFKMGDIPTLPYFDMPDMPKDLPRAVTEAELPVILAACQTARDKALVMFLAESGLRATEALAVNWRDLSFDGRRVRVDVKRGKGGKPRTTYASPETWALLMEYRAEEHLDSPLAKRLEAKHPIALWVRGRMKRSGAFWGRLTYDGLRSALVRIGKRADMPWLHAHAFRHRAGRWLRRMGLSREARQDILGHVVGSPITDTYSSVQAEEAEEEFVKALNGH